MSSEEYGIHSREEEIETFQLKRCCSNCAHYEPEESECQEGGYSEIGDPNIERTPEDCNAFELI